MDKTNEPTCFGLPDDQAWKRSYMRLPAIVGETDGVPVRAFGRVFVHGVSPDFETGVVLQQGNARPQTKIKPKRSWEIQGENYIGSMVSYQPCLPAHDFQPQIALHLIDGNPETHWCCRGEGQADVIPNWVRVDLPIERELREIVLVPRKDGLPWPKELTIKVSCDAWHWMTVFETSVEKPPQDGKPVRVKFDTPTPVKQIWVIGNQLPFDERGSDRDYIFSFSGVQAITESGENVALLSRGAGVTVSSTYAYGGTWTLNDIMWPIQYDMGAKWIRLSGGNPPFHHDTLQWRFVEQEKGKFIIDEKTRAAMIEATDNGCQVIVQLAYGNWLYHHERLSPDLQGFPSYLWSDRVDPKRQEISMRNFPAAMPPAPITREHIDAYKRWVREMVTQFKGGVAYWEIWNEPIFWGWEIVKDYDARLKAYCDLAKEVIPVIREADPNAKVSLAGMAGIPGDLMPGNMKKEDWLTACLKQGLAPLVDLLQWHIQGGLLPDIPNNWAAYPDAIRGFQRAAESMGFRGTYVASEYWVAAPYPTHAAWAHPPHWELPGLPRITEIRKAKDTARVFVANAAVNVRTCWCNTWWTSPRDCGVFRNTWASDPMSAEQPEPVYYALRTLSTALEGLRPARFDVQFSATGQPMEAVTFDHDSGRVAAVWVGGLSVDRHPGAVTDVIVSAKSCRKVIAVDVLNGFEQELAFEQRGDRVVIPQVLVRDYPLLLRLESK